MIRNFQSGESQRVLSGPGAIETLPEQLKKLNKKRAFILTGATLSNDTDLVRNLEALLGKTWVGTFSGCTQHVLSGSVSHATQAARQADPDVLISFGGGSPTDTTKHVAMNLLDDRPREALPQVVIPTTLSAGEFTFHAGVTDEDSRVKSGRRDPRALPSIIVFDPNLCAATPADLWASTGIKALDHAVEKLWSPRAHPVSDTLAIEAIRLLTSNLPASLDPSNLEARLNCQHASWMSMYGVMNLGLRLSHPLGHQIGARWDVPHGITSCIVLPHVMRYLLPKVPAAHAKIAQALHIPEKSIADPEAPATTLEALIQDLHLPSQLSQTPAQQNELPQVAHEVSRELIRAKSPDAQTATPEILLQLLNKMW